MAKALLGHIGDRDTYLATELRRLQQRVRELETELLRLQRENDLLSAVGDRRRSLLDACSDLLERHSMDMDATPAS